MELTPFIITLVSIVGSFATVLLTHYLNKRGRKEHYREFLYKQKFNAHMAIYKAFYNLIYFASNEHGLYNAAGEFHKDTALQFLDSCREVRTEIYKNLLFVSPKSLKVLLDQIRLLDDADYRGLADEDFHSFFFQRFWKVLAHFRSELGFEALTDDIVEKLFDEKGAIYR